MGKTFAIKVVKKIASQIGAKVILEPEFARVGQIIFKNGKKTLFRYHKFNINGLGAVEIARDKDYAKFFLKRAGFKVAKGQTFFDDYLNQALPKANQRKVDDAIKYLKIIGIPAIIKPNDFSQGKLVTKIYNAEELKRAAKEIFKLTHVLLIEKFYTGNDYRIVVLDNQIISAYQRLPLFIIGDGNKTIQELLQDKQKLFTKQGRDTIINLNDLRFIDNLKRQKLNLKSVVAKNIKINLLDNANLSTGGESLDVTDKIHPDYKKLAIKITKEMDLRLCGVDLIAKDKITKPLSEYVILEVNGAPGLSNYAQNGKKQKKIVEDLYLKILKTLEKNNKKR